MGGQNEGGRDRGGVEGQRMDRGRDSDRWKSTRKVKGRREEKEHK